MDREVMHERDRLIPRLAGLSTCDFWYEPELEFLRAAFDKSQANVTGEARVRLFKGSVRATVRRSHLAVQRSAQHDGRRRQSRHLRAGRRHGLHPPAELAAAAPALILNPVAGAVWNSSESWWPGSSQWRFGTTWPARAWLPLAANARSMDSTDGGKGRRLWVATGICFFFATWKCRAMRRGWLFADLRHSRQRRHISSHTEFKASAGFLQLARRERLRSR